MNQALLAKGAIKEQKVKSDDLVTVEQKVKPAQKEREGGAKKVNCYCYLKWCLFSANFFRVSSF